MSDLNQISFANSPLYLIRQWLEHLEVHNPKVARFLCKMIPAQCPFERNIELFHRILVHIPHGHFALTVVGYWLGKKEHTFTVHAWQFLPVGFLYPFISGLIGSKGSAVNPFYLNYGLIKEQMIATKAANIVVVHVVKIVTYAAFGALTTQYLGYGLIIGLTAIPANCLG